MMMQLDGIEADISRLSIEMARLQSQDGAQFEVSALQRQADALVAVYTAGLLYKARHRITRNRKESQ